MYLHISSLLYRFDDLDLAVQLLRPAVSDGGDYNLPMLLDRRHQASRGRSCPPACMRTQLTSSSLTARTSITKGTYKMLALLEKIVSCNPVICTYVDNSDSAGLEGVQELRLVGVGCDGGRADEHSRPVAGVEARRHKVLPDVPRPADHQYPAHCRATSSSAVEIGVERARVWLGFGSVGRDMSREQFVYPCRRTRGHRAILAVGAGSYMFLGICEGP